MRHEYSARLDNVLIRQLSSGDIELLRTWRNDESNSVFLRKIDFITETMQKEWFEKYLENEHEVVFAIKETKELNRVVGSLALYNWDKATKTCEIGKIQIGDNEAHGKGIGRKALVMTMKIAFRCLNIRTIKASVHPENIQAYHNDMKIGFRIVGEIPSIAGGYEFELMIQEEDARKANEYYDSIAI